MKENLFKILSLLIILSSCIEKYEPKTTVFEPVLVVESTITNEYKKQQVKLSRAIPLDSIIPDSEKNAIVKITTSNGNTYDFTEIEAGLYQSNDVFQAEPETAYQLYIKTENGKEYQSTKEQLTPLAPIENVYAENETVDGKLGVQVYVDSQENPDAKYFRYEYEETYKLITPYPIYINVELEGNVYEYQFIVTPLTNSQRQKKHICYPNGKNNQIILGNTLNRYPHKIEKLPVKFINYDDYRIAERYSIIIKQYVLNSDAYAFYKSLKDLGENTGGLSSIQQGFVKGNIDAMNSKDEVVGFFNVNSVSQKRIYFNYSQFGFSKPEYPFQCDVTRQLDYNDNEPAIWDGDEDERYLIYTLLENRTPPYEALYFINQPKLIALVNPECSNCSAYYPSTRPDFWQD